MFDVGLPLQSSLLSSSVAVEVFAKREEEEIQEEDGN